LIEGQLRLECLDGRCIKHDTFGKARLVNQKFVDIVALESIIAGPSIPVFRYKMKGEYLMQRSFSGSKAAFSVFSLTGRDPLFVLKYCFLNLLLFAIIFGAAVYGGLIEAFTNLATTTSSGTEVEHNDILALYSNMAPSLILIGLLSGFFGLMMTTMALRKLVRQEDAGVLGLQIGSDELRLFLAYLGLSGLGLAFFTVLAIVAGAVIAGMALGMGGGQNGGTSIILGLLILGIYIIAAFVAMRFCQFGVMAIANKKVGVFQSWGETKDNFWRFLGAYLLWAIVSIIGGSIIQSVLLVVSGLVSGAGFGALGSTGAPTDVAQMLSVTGVIYILTSGLVSGFTQLGYLCVGASAWQQKYGGVTSDIDAF
jgi:hypothetical protein